MSGTFNMTNVVERNRKGDSVINLSDSHWISRTLTGNKKNVMTTSSPPAVTCCDPNPHMVHFIKPHGDYYYKAMKVNLHYSSQLSNTNGHITLVADVFLTGGQLARGTKDHHTIKHLNSTAGVCWWLSGQNGGHIPDLVSFK